MSEINRFPDLDLVPLKPVEQLEREVDTYAGEIGSQMRKRKSEVDVEVFASGVRGDIDYDVRGEASLEDVLAVVSGEPGDIVYEEVDREGSTDVGSVCGYDGLEDYLRYFFRDDEVESVYRVDVSVGDTELWGESYFLSGYSHEQGDVVDFGPADVFEGPKLRYMQVGVARGEGETMYEDSGIMSKRIHPHHQLDTYARQEDSKVDEILQQTPEKPV
jgi:hypothetical protein